MERKYTKVLARMAPSMDPLIIVALARIFTVVREVLDLSDDFTIEETPAGHLRWGPYKGCSFAELDDMGILPIGVGGGKLDEHEHTRRETAEQQEGPSAGSALDLVLLTEALRERIAEKVGGSWAFLELLLMRITGNDEKGTYLSRDRANLRTAATALNVVHQFEIENVYTFVEIALRGLLLASKWQREGRLTINLDDPFSRETIEAAVTATLPEEAEAFKKEYKDAIVFDAAEFKQALRDWKDAVRRRIEIPKNDASGDQAGRIGELRRKYFTFFEFTTNSTKAAQAARSKNADVAIIWRSSGHVQIITRKLTLKGGVKAMIDLRPIAAALRVAEIVAHDIDVLRFAQRHGGSERDGFWGTGEECPWFLPEYPGQIMNGSLGNPAMSATRLSKREVAAIVEDVLLSCPLVYDEEEKK